MSDPDKSIADPYPSVCIAFCTISNFSCTQHALHHVLAYGSR